MNSDSPTYNSERTEGLAWLRDVLTCALEVCPLSYQQKRKTVRFLNRMPDWLMADWAEALNIDYIGGCTRYPDMAEKANSETGRQLAQQYLESHDAVPAGNSLDQLSKSIMEDEAGELPVNSETVEKQACALALAGCTSEGAAFAESARDTLGDAGNPNHPLVDYHLALEQRDKSKIEALDAALAGGRYGNWVAERITETKRYLGLEPPRFMIRRGERTPQWDLLWQKIFTGGDEN